MNLNAATSAPVTPAAKLDEEAKAIGDTTAK